MSADPDVLFCTGNNPRNPTGCVTGHTAGQVGYLVTVADRDRQLLIGGDSLHHPILHVRHPEWTTAGDSHPDLVRQTRLQLLNQLANKNILFRCYQFAPDEIGYVKRNAKGGFLFVKSLH